MGGLSGMHWLLVLLVVLIVFGAGKLPRVAGDLAQGIKNFKKGMQDGENEAAQPKPVQQTSETQPRPTISSDEIHTAENASRDKVSHS